MKVEDKSNATFAMKVQEISRIANEAVYQAKQENIALGLSTPVWYNGAVWFELPDGTLTQNDPSLKDHD